MRLSDEPRGWRRLQAMAQSEDNPERVAAIIDEMNRLLEAHERMTGSCETVIAGWED